MKQDYPDLIKIEMFNKEWVPQDTLLSAVARKKHGIAKAGDKKKGAVLIALKAMYRKGELKKEVDEDGNVFWGKRTPGDIPIDLRTRAVVQVDPLELMRLTTARKNIRLLEESLKIYCAKAFIEAYGLEWEKHLEDKTREILSGQYLRARHDTWKAGGLPEDLFSVVGISDFSYMIGDKNNRDIFSSVFPNTFIVAGKLAELSDYRNRIQHNEALAKEEYLFFNIAAELLIKKLI